MILMLIQSSAILVLALCAVRLLRRQSAATRHLILTVGLISSLVVPLVGSVLPESRFARVTATYMERGWKKLQSDRSGEPRSITVVETPAGELADDAPLQFSYGLILNAMPSRVLLWIWLGGTAISGVVSVSGTGRVLWLLFRSKPVVLTTWVVASKEIASALLLKRRFELLQCNGAVLGTWGVLRPRVFLPLDAEAWSRERIRLVLTHELAHIKRLDWPVQVLAEVARAVCWFNPLYWLTCRVLRSASEQACDDVVLNAGFDAKDYAAHLLDLARMLKSVQRAPVLTMSRLPDLERRFVAMLNPSLNHRSVGRWAVLSICVVAICIALPLAAMRAPSPEQVQPGISPSPVPIASSRTVEAPAAVSRVTARPAATKPRPAQGLADGSLSGTISDATGAVVPGVTVTVAGRLVQLEAVTNEVGRYEFRALPEGAYSLVAQLPGFVSAGRRVQIQSSQTSRADITLSVGSIAQRVTVNAAGIPKPAPISGTVQRIRVGGNVKAANLVSQVKPIYPQAAQDAGIEGIIHLQGTIGPDGTLVGLRALNKFDPDLVNAALEAVSQWRYQPTLLNGEPIGVSTQIDVEFKLAQ